MQDELLARRLRRFLSEKNVEVTEKIDARKVKIEADEAWELLSSGSKIMLAKGKSIIEIDTKDADRFEVLKTALGRSGSLRAPTIKLGDTWIVGFNEEIYSTKL